MDSFTPADYVKWFRHSSPYINAHRGKTFVIAFPGETLTHANFQHLVHDIALLDSLGIKLVLVHGARPQINEQLQKAAITPQFLQGRRITDAASMSAVEEAVGKARLHIEALLSMGIANSPMHGASIQVCSGNFIVAKPWGVRGGIDFLHSGEVRKVRTDAIRALMQHDIITLLSPIGYSPTGEAFNLLWEEVAEATALALNADKLILLTPDAGLLDADGALRRELTTLEAEHTISHFSEDAQRLLNSAVSAVRGGVPRAHLISYQEDGALLRELFSRDGSGTLVTDASFERLRAASIDDVGGILELIAPLEREGVLVRRSRELLEAEIERFCVIERDGSIIACAALYPYDTESPTHAGAVGATADATAAGEETSCGELACVAVHPDYRHGGRGDALLDFIEKKAIIHGLNRLFVLTTRTAHWFVERGFVETSVDALPQPKQSLYNYQRRSKVFIKPVG